VIDTRWFKYGLGRDFQACLTAALAVLGALWTPVEIAGFFLPDLDRFRIPVLFPILITTSVVVGVRVGVRPRSTELSIGSSDTVVSITVGDLMTTPGARVIPVNDFFDCDLGRHVSPRSLHGQFLVQCFPNRGEDFCAAVDAALDRDLAMVVDRESGRSLRYPIGTVARIDVGEDCYLLVALTHTEVHTLKASATTFDLWRALDGLWERARYLANGREVVVPLVGSGLSGIGLPVGQLLELLLISLVEATKDRKVSDRVVVVLTEQHLELIDLREVHENWHP
jgi:hypothetical protein